MATNTADITVGFCLDQSGSMLSQIDEACKGFNAFKEEQANLKGNAYLSLILFDTTTTLRFSGGDMKLVDDLGTTVNPYSPSGQTALYDAVDEMITAMEGWHAANPSFGGQTIIVIFTDGGENASRSTPIEKLNQRIRDKKENDDWSFLFLGSGGASWTEGRTMATAGATGLNYSGLKGSTRAAYNVLSSSVTQSRTTGQSVNSTFAASAASMQADPNLQHQQTPQPGKLRRPVPKATKRTPPKEDDKK